MAVSGSTIVDHIIEHEILGIDSSLSNVKVSEGRLWVYDTIRSKWLSSDRFDVVAGRNGRVRNGYLRIVDGLASSASGYRIIRPATITAVGAQGRTLQDWTLRVRKNNETTELVSLTMMGVTGNHDTTIDVDLDEGDMIQFYANTDAFVGVKNIAVWAEVAWRNDNL
jgi:hypothetical protein